MTTYGIQYEDVEPKMRAKCDKCGLKPQGKRFYITEQNNGYIHSYAVCWTCAPEILKGIQEEIMSEVAYFKGLQDRVESDLFKRASEDNLKLLEEVIFKENK